MHGVYVLMTQHSDGAATTALTWDMQLESTSLDIDCVLPLRCSAAFFSFSWTKQEVYSVTRLQ